MVGIREGSAVSRRLRFPRIAGNDTFRGEWLDMPWLPCIVPRRAGCRVGRWRGTSCALFHRPPAEPDVRVSRHPALQNHAARWKASESQERFGHPQLASLLCFGLGGSCSPSCRPRAADEANSVAHPPRGWEAIPYVRTEDVLVRFGARWSRFHEVLPHRSPESACAGLYQGPTFLVLPSQTGYGRWSVAPLETGGRQISLTRRPGLRGTLSSRSSDFPAFPACSCPLWLSPPGKLVSYRSLALNRSFLRKESSPRRYGARRSRPHRGAP